MSAGPLLVALAGYHLIPCLLACAVIHGALAVLARLSPLRQAHHRVILLYLALLKGALALFAGAGISCLASHSRFFGYFYLQWPDLLPDRSPLERTGRLAALVANPELSGVVLLAVLALAIALLSYRWVRIAPVYRAIYASRRAEPEACWRAAAALSEVVELAQRTGWRTAPPRLLVIRDSPAPAFTIGLRAPVIVLSAELARELGEPELKGVLAHELAHVRRLDYPGRWIATILRDVMFWNPFAALWYERLVNEQEKACDLRGAELLGDARAVASGLVEVAAHVQRLRLVAVGPLTVWRRERDLSSLSQRIDSLVAAFGQAEGARRNWWRLPAYAVVAAFLAAQPRVAVVFPQLLARLLSSD
ncbi:MAG: M56 family metallopeptidase [Armatimonadota bacterium]